MYKNYIFDLYGTIVDINTDEQDISLYEKMVDFLKTYNVNYSADELKIAYENECKNQERKLIKKTHYVYPEIDIAKVFIKLYENKGVKVSNKIIEETAKAFRIYSTKYIRLYDGVIDLLNLLKEKRKKIYLLSNAQYLFTFFELEQLGLLKYFDGILISSNEKVKKPDVEFFNKLFIKYNLNKNESIMIGNDSTSDIKGANDFGIDSLYFYSNISPTNDKDKYSNAKYHLDELDYNEVSKLIIK